MGHGMTNFSYLEVQVKSKNCSQKKQHLCSAFANKTNTTKQNTPPGLRAWGVLHQGCTLLLRQVCGDWLVVDLHRREIDPDQTNDRPDWILPPVVRSLPMDPLLRDQVLPGPGGPIYGLQMIQDQVLKKVLCLEEWQWSSLRQKTPTSAPTMVLQTAGCCGRQVLSSCHWSAMATNGPGWPMALVPEKLFEAVWGQGSTMEDATGYFGQGGIMADRCITDTTTCLL